MGIDEVLSREKINRLKSFLCNAHRVAIVCHARPDGDAIGSMTALLQLLHTDGHDVLGIAPTTVPPPLRWVEGFRFVKTYSADSDSIDSAIAGAQLFIHVDHNAIRRVDPALEQTLRASSAPRVMIDHHIFPVNEEFALSFSRPESSSTCELLYELINRTWGIDQITPSIADCLYMGILTDTGSFAHSCSHKRTFEVAGSLVERGADVPKIRSHVLGSYSQQRYRLYGDAMSSRTDFFANGQAAIIVLSENFLKQHDFTSGDTEGLVNEPLTVEGVVISALLSERPDGYIRVSLRSRKNAEVNSIARNHFNGGGHPQASGGTLEMPLREAALFVRLVIAKAIEMRECFSSQQSQISC